MLFPYLLYNNTDQRDQVNKILGCFRAYDGVFEHPISIRGVFKIKQEKISYFRSKNNNIEFIYSNNSDNSFQEHSHVSTYTIGLILDGSIRLKRKDKFVTCEKDHFFIIPPYEPHAILVDDLYTMIAISIKADFVLEYKLEETESDDSIQLIRKALEQIPQQEVSLDELSQAAFMSKYHFIIEFKKQVGLTPHHFQIQNRIRKAQCLLLEYKNASIAEVASVTGFCDQSHFIKSFKKIVGLTPSQYIEAQHILHD